MRPCDRARRLAPPSGLLPACNLKTSIPTSPAAARGGATRCRVAPDICRKSKGALCMQSGCQNWRLSTCNNLCRFGWDFSHDLTAICIEIKVEAATKAHGNVSAAMGFMAPAAASAPAQTAAECGRRIWPGLAWRTRNVASRKRKSIRERVAKIKSTKRRRLRCQPTRLLPQTWSRFPRINNTQQIYSKWPPSKSERFSPWVACAQRARKRERERHSAESPNCVAWQP